MDNELLARLLATHNRLIIPNFGAFLRKETASGSRQIVFSPFLKKDDGVLTQILIEEYGVEHFDAESMITEWVAHIKDALAANQKYHIEDIGVLVVDANGALTMVASPAKPAAPAPKLATPAPTPVVTPTIETAHIAQPAPIVAPEPVAAPVIPQPIAQPAPQPIAQPAPQPIAQPKPVIPQPAPQQIPQPIAQPAPQPIAQPQVPPMQGRPAIPSLNAANVARPTPTAAPRPMATISQPNNPAQQNWQRPAAGVPNSAMPNNNPNIAGRPTGQPPVGNRQPQNPMNRPPQGNRQPGAPTQQRQAGPMKTGQRPTQRPPRGKQKKQVETLLIIAIIAAILITALIIYGLLTVNPTNQIYNGEI